jgi:predicted ester cyclase
MSIEENMALARRFLEARGRADLDAMEEMVAPDFVDRSLAPGQQPDREGYKRQVAEYVTAFSDVRFVIEDQVAAGDKVVSRISGRGTHDQRELLGAAPTGREMTYMAIIIHRISGDKVVEEWGVGTGLSELRGQRLQQEVRERERVEQELRVARRIQQALLPKEVPAPEGWEIAQYYQPAREVGGDFYDFLKLEDGRVGLIIGDVSGKGIPAAVLMASTRSVLRAVAQRALMPGQVLAEANEVLSADVPPSMFVTCFYSILDPSSGRFHYANAGHNLPYWQHEDLASEMRATGMPLGLLPGMQYEEKEAMLVPGDTILFYSDGLVEAHNAAGEMFGDRRLQSFVTNHSAGGESLITELLVELAKFTGADGEQEDDITLLTLERCASRS